MRAAVESTRRPEVAGRPRRVRVRDHDPRGLPRAGHRVARPTASGRRPRSPPPLGRLDTIGIDLVAMCADDVVCSGAEPRRVPRLHRRRAPGPGRASPTLVAGVADGCRQAGRALIGGETAEHPGLMAADDFDLAGFCIGVGERSRLLDGDRGPRRRRDRGLASSGLHANGYSLVRALVADHELDLARAVPGASAPALGDAAADAALAAEPHLAMATLGEVLLTPTRIYALDVLAIRAALEADGTELRGIAHITGGGLPGNVPRALPAALGARLDPSRWPMPSVMRLLGRARRGRRRGAARDVQRRARHGAGRAAGGRRAATVALARERGIPAWARRRGGRGHRARRRPVRRGGDGVTRRAAGADRRRGLGDRIQPPRAGRRGRSRGRSAARSRWCSPTARARRSTGRPSRGSRRRSCRAATTRRWPRR